MRFTARQTLKHCLIAVAATLAGLLAIGGAAQAAVTAAPEITVTPANPNTTHALSMFKYTAGEGETSTASTITFLCRVYNSDGTPPSGNTGFAACGSTSPTNPQEATKSYAQANGNWTFEVTASENSVVNHGPIASANWTQSISAPTEVPVITAHPDNPTTTTTSQLKYAAGTGEVDLVDRFQCRLDSTEASDWTSCAASGQTYSPGNGEHTFEVRAGNLAGWGPGESTTWTVDVPNPSSSIKIKDVAFGTWNGGAANANLGPNSNIGDINDDGIDDQGFASREGSDGMVDIVFGKSGAFGDRTVGTQSAGEGFRIVPLPGSNGGPLWVSGIGDQNDDGIDDLVVLYASVTELFFPGSGFFGPGSARVAVIYGGLDVNALPACPSGPSRCLNLEDGLTADQGYVLDTESDSVGGATREGGVATGDFDGDGVDDLFFGNGVNTGEYTVVKGKERSGLVLVSDLADTEKLVVTTDPKGGDSVVDLGDLDGDGRSDVFLEMSQVGTHTVLYGRTFGEGEFDLAALSADDGFRIYGPAQQSLTVSAVGDLNRDGTSDLAATLYGGISDDVDKTVGFFYAPERGSGDALIVGPDMDPSTGYVVDRGGSEEARLGQSRTQPIGDFDNDGTPDSLVSAEATPVDGLPTSGAAYVLFGQNPKPDSLLGVGQSLAPSLGIGLLGARSENVGGVDTSGSSIASLGDTDGDGLADFAIGAPYADPNGVHWAGSVYIVPGKSLINQVKTGKAAGVANTSAVLNAGLSTNNRNSEVWFEYGTSDDYGQSTDPESFEASNTGDAASAAVSGLAKNTEYHYRAVAKNALGLVRYGDDKTFTTTNADNPGGDPCAVDSSKPGCADYCKANPTAMGCPDYDWCAANPGKCSTAGPAKLSLISITKKITVKRGKKGTVQVAVINAGGKAAKGVKVCVKAPKKLVKVKACAKVGSLGSGASRTVKIKVKAKRKKGKATLKLTATGNGLGKKSAKAKVVIR